MIKYIYEEIFEIEEYLNETSEIINIKKADKKTIFLFLS